MRDAFGMFRGSRHQGSRCDGRFRARTGLKILNVAACSTDLDGATTISTTREFTTLIWSKSFLLNVLMTVDISIPILLLRQLLPLRHAEDKLLKRGSCQTAFARPVLHEDHLVTCWAWFTNSRTRGIKTTPQTGYGNCRLSQHRPSIQHPFLEARWASQKLQTLTPRRGA